MITARELSARYGRTPVFENMTFSLDEGLVHGLIGPNGSGKTTLLRVIAGQLQHSGELLVNGHEPFDNLTVMNNTVLAGIDAPLPDEWNATKLFRLAAQRHEYFSQVRANELVERFELPLTKRYGTLSRGQKSALSFIYAIASGCELLLLDEPYLGLDVAKRDIFYDVLAEERSTGRTVVISTHHLHEVEKLLDTVLLLDASSNVIVNGPVDELAEGIVEITGSDDAVSRALARLGGVPVLDQESIATGTRVVIDCRSQAGLADCVFDLPSQIGERLKVRPVTLEHAVLAMQESGR